MRTRPLQWSELIEYHEHVAMRAMHNTKTAAFWALLQ